MSADAKMFQRGTHGDGWNNWVGHHDVPPTEHCREHQDGDTLTRCLSSIETCVGQSLRWELTVGPDGPLLRGFEA